MTEELDPLMGASRVMVAALVRSLAAARTELSVAQLRVLAVLAVQEPRTVSDVARTLGVNPSNASRTCDRLAALGLVERQASVEDRRQVGLALTREGRALVDDVLDHRRALLGNVVAEMSPEGRKRLLRALEEFTAAAARTDLIEPAESGDAHLVTWLR